GRARSRAGARHRSAETGVQCAGERVVLRTARGLRAPLDHGLAAARARPVRLRCPGWHARGASHGPQELRHTAVESLESVAMVRPVDRARASARDGGGVMRVCVVAPAYMTGGQAIEARTLVD